MTRTRTLIRGGILVASVLALAGCGASAPGQATGRTSTPSSAAIASPTSGTPATLAGSPPAAGSDLSAFDPCSVVSDSDLVKAITAGASDPSALGTVTATHVAVDGTETGLPGAKACSQTWTTTDSAGRVSQGGEPVIVTFDLYSNLQEIQSGSPDDTTTYGSAGAVAFDAPGDAGDPHLTKDGYLFRMSGNSDLAFLKTIALGIAARL
jgi:hypothetical protein